ncbi:MFS transporter [Streptomyces litchfieldiae]|uniref:MFS transporter n=1 Tax=Streptomyces litchfieldiae TaxID=3075543 RepID=A0ABU2MSK5_9ACTN|nr:MFS transporter [Streptomyces sp. DSM 44938]MDT0344505.1 MFS transporter [Streptomyces sp. DSM 44938]
MATPLTEQLADASHSPDPHAPAAPAAAPAPRQTLSGRAWGMLFVLCGALFLDALDASMKGVALPSIGADLAMSTSSLQWVVSGYVLGFGGFLLLGGRAADLLGRRRVFLLALATFLVTSVLGGLAPNGELLVAARFLTGVSAAFTAPAGLSIITTSFAEGPARNKALTIYTATGASGFSLGLVAGGLLTEVSWRWVFFAPALVAGLTLLGGLWLIPRSSRPTGPRQGFDLAGAVSVTAAMLLLVFTLIQAPEVGWGSARTLGSLVGVAALLAAFVAIERRAAAPLVRLSLLRSGAVVQANVGAMALLGAWLGALFILTLYMQDVRGWSALTTGLAVAPSGAVVVLLAPRIVAPLVARFGAPRVILAGLVAASLAYLALLPLDGDSAYATGMLPAFLLAGLAFTFAYGPLNILATNGIAAEEQGVASGLVNTSFQFGAALSLAVVTAVQRAGAGEGHSPDALLEGLSSALWVPLVVSLLGVAVVAPGVLRRRSSVR